jgi:hypothetical protein
MHAREISILLVLGLCLWIVGTILFAKVGPALLETTTLRYWSSFVLSPILSGALCIVILLWRHIAPADWSTAVLLLVIPGMMGEAVALSNLPAFVPSLHVGSAGRYGAFLFATYGFVLAVAEVVTLRARS